RRNEFRFDYNFANDFTKRSACIQLGDWRRWLNGDLRFESRWLERAPADAHAKADQHFSAMESQDRARDRFHIRSTRHTTGVRDGLKRCESAPVDRASRAGRFAFVVTGWAFHRFHLWCRG